MVGSLVVFRFLPRSGLPFARKPVDIGQNWTLCGGKEEHTLTGLISRFKSLCSIKLLMRSARTLLR